MMNNNMASAPSSDARARYLQDAAHSLVVSSPAVSAFLGNAYNTMVEDAGDISLKERDSVRRQFCGACGNLFVPGWSCRIVMKSVSEQDGKNSKALKKAKVLPPTTTKNLVYTCLRCHRETISAIQPKPRSLKTSKGQKQALPVRETKGPTIEDTSKVAKTTNATSKQRQKARKGGLQAMLDKNKSQSSNSGGFDLMDFAM